MANGKLQKLIAQRAALEARIRQEQNRENEKKRKADTRRKILAGAVVLDEAEKHPEYKAALFRLLDRFLTRPDDRALFGLEPLSQSKGTGKPLPRNAIVSMESPKSES
jgi:hypothetical protein